MAAYNLRYIYLAVFVCLNIVKAYFPDLILDFDSEILLPVWAQGATYYAKKIGSTIYYKSGSVPTAADSSVADLSAVIELEAVTAGDTVYVCAGTFTGTEIDSDANINIAKELAYFGGMPSTDANYALHGGTVTLDANGATVNEGIVRPTVNHTTTGVIGRLTLTNTATASGNYGFYTAANNWHFDDIIVTKAGRGFAVLDGTGTVINRLMVKDIVSTSGLGYFTVTFTLNGLIAENCPGGSWFHGGNPIINNFVLNGSSADAFLYVDVGSPVFNNGIIMNAGYANGAKYALFEGGTGAATCNNCIVLPNVADLAKISTGDWTLTNCLYKNPMFKSGRRPAIAVFGVDDYGNLAYMQMVAAKLQGYGWRGTYALNKSASLSDYTPIQALVSAGHTIAAHGDSYSNLMTDRTGLSMTYAGAATAADCAVTGAGDYATGLSCVNDSVKVIDLDLTLAANNTIDKVVAVVNVGTATHGYTAAKRNTDSGNAVASKYLKTQSLDVKAGAKNFDLDDTRVFKGEMRDVKAALGTGIGSTVNGWVCPGNGSDAPMRSALLSYGFTGARGDGTTSTHLMSSINIFNITPVSLYSLFGNDANPQNTANKVESYVASTMEYLKYIGGIKFFYAHTTSELSAAGWDALLAEVNKSGIQVMTLDAAVAYLKTYDPSGDVATADSLTYTRTMVDAADYSLRPGSPAINAGVDVSLTTDFLGKPIRGVPDIGAYEHYGVTGNFSFTFGMGF